MTKQELIDKIATKAEISKVAAGKALNAVLESVTEAAKKGETVRMIGFGTFSVSNKAARIGRNPSTGEQIKIPAKKVLKFKPSSTIKLEAPAAKAAKKPAAKAAAPKKPAAKKAAPKKK